MTNNIYMEDILALYHYILSEYKTVYGKLDAVCGMTVLKAVTLLEDIKTLGVAGVNRNGIYRGAILRAVGKVRIKT